MKHVINSKSYDTAKSTLVGEYTNGYGWNDFRYLHERLYVTKKGNWFLHGEGGALTEYAEHHGNAKSGGELIKEFTRGQALEWLSSTKQNKAAEQYFADLIEEA